MGWLSSAPPVRCAVAPGVHRGRVAALDERFPLHRTRAAAGSAGRDHPQALRLLEQRRAGGGPDVIIAGSGRWCAELGLSLRMGARRLVLRICIAADWLRKR